MYGDIPCYKDSKGDVLLGGLRDYYCCCCCYCGYPFIYLTWRLDRNVFELARLLLGVLKL